MYGFHGAVSGIARALMATERNYPRNYPEWRSKVKTKGRRDRSLRQRSNRRKAAARGR